MTTTTRPPLRRTADPPDNQAFGLPRWFQVDGAETEGAFCSWIEEVPPGAGPPLHVHHRETEVFTLLSGRLRFQLQDEQLEAEAGDNILIPRGLPHTFHNHTNSPTRVLVCLTPGGGDGFFRDVEAEGLGPDDMPRIEEIASQYGLEFVGPPMS